MLGTPTAPREQIRTGRDVMKPRATAVRRLERATGQLAGAATSRMESELPWYAAMPAPDRAWINLVLQAGIAAFVQWYRDPSRPHAITADVFGTAPRELVRAVTLQQTVELVRTTIEVVEESAQDLVAEQDLPGLREAALRYSREIAFAAAEVYARAAEARGAWDARLRSLVIDAILRDDDASGVASQGVALGWADVRDIAVVVGDAPHGAPDEAVDRLRAQSRIRDLLVGVTGGRLVVVLGGVDDPLHAATSLLPSFGKGAVVVGPLVESLSEANLSAREALSAYDAAAGWPDAPRPALAGDLLPERALAGDERARDRLVAVTYDRLHTEPMLMATLSAFLERTGGLEATARELYVHANTVRYRLRRIGEITGYVPTHPRDGYALRLGLTLGRLRGG